MHNSQVRLRPASEEDIPFIFSSWLKSYKASPDMTHIDNNIFFTEQHRLIEFLLKNGKVLIACNNIDPTQLFGWICCDKIDNIFCLHYVYVKHTFRKMGICASLLKAFGHSTEMAGVYTHHTKVMEVLRHKFNLLHHPYILINDYYKKE